MPKGFLIRSSCLLLLCLFGASGLQAQELVCRVKVNDQQVSSSEKRVFREMENTFAQFLNDRSWTNEKFGQGEKINCNIQIVLDEPERVGVYTGNMIVQVARPVYNSSYTTSTFMFPDRDLSFEYVESQPLDFNENNFTSNLTSILAFYAYVIIGMDFDSFSPEGGSPYFEKARNIAQIARQTGISGWDQNSNNGRNRAGLIENLMNSQMVPLRELNYSYHRLVLDTFGEDPDQGREVLVEGLEKLREVRKLNANSILLNIFLRNKEDEMTNIFSKGDMAVRRKAMEILTAIDPSGADKYSRITKQN